MTTVEASTETEAPAQGEVPKDRRRGQTGATATRDALVLEVLERAQYSGEDKVGVSRTGLADAVNAEKPDAGMTDSLTYLSLIRLRTAGKAVQFRNYGESRWKTPGEHVVLARPKPERKRPAATEAAPVTENAEAVAAE